MKMLLFTLFTGFENSLKKISENPRIWEGAIRPYTVVDEQCDLLLQQIAYFFDPCILSNDFHTFWTRVTQIFYCNDLPTFWTLVYYRFTTATICLLFWTVVLQIYYCNDLPTFWTLVYCRFSTATICLLFGPLYTTDLLLQRFAYFFGL